MLAVRLVLIALCALPPLAAQPSSALERQKASIERQRMTLEPRKEVESGQRQSFARQQAAVERQREKAIKQAETGSDTGFFTLPWPEPPRFVPATGPGGATAAMFDCMPVPASELEAILERSALDNSLSPELLRAVVRRESAFHPCAVSRAGAMGLMQLMPATAETLGVSDPFDPAENIQAGSRYLRHLLERYGGDLMLALGAYNAGPGRVDRSGGLPPIPETQDYVRGILSELSPVRRHD